MYSKTKNRFIATAATLLAVAAVPAGAADLRVSGPYNHKNLSIYLVHGKDRVQKNYLTLSEAMAQGKVVVHETGDVNQLQIENLSADDVYVQSGEIVKGGKQDRVLKDDMILSSRSGRVNAAAFCVEQGRWQKRGSEPVQAFGAAPKAIASPEMKRAVKEKANQRDVWAEVAAAQGRLAKNLGGEVRSEASASSYQLTLENGKLRETVEGFQKALAALADRHPDSLGYVMAVNGQVTGADLYANHGLFRKVWGKMLESAAVEAISAAPANGKVAPPPALADVEAAANGTGAKVTAESQVNNRTRATKADMQKGILFETRDSAGPAAAGPVHRSYISK